MRVPATTANLGPGFDTLGMALALFNEVSVEPTTSGLDIAAIGDAADLPLDATNLVARAARALFERTGKPMPGLRIRVKQRIPVSRGLGSSAAAIVAGLVAANVLVGRPLSCSDILELAAEIEGHPDNVAAAMLGGLVVSWSIGAGASRCYRHVKLGLPEGLRVVVAIPDLRVPTEKARQVLPQTVSLADAVHNVSRTALLVASLTHGQLDFLSQAMEDRLHQPYRAALTPGLEDVLAAALGAGARGAALSGSGPSVIAFAVEKPRAIASAMAAAFASHGVNCRTIITRPSRRGAMFACTEGERGSGGGS